MVSWVPLRDEWIKHTLRFDVNLAVFFVPLERGLLGFLTDLGSLIPREAADGAIAVELNGDLGNSAKSDSLCDEDSREEEEDEDEMSREMVGVGVAAVGSDRVSVLSEKEDLNILIIPTRCRITKGDGDRARLYFLDSLPVVGRLRRNFGGRQVPRCSSVKRHSLSSSPFLSFRVSSQHHNSRMDKVSSQS